MNKQELIEKYKTKGEARKEFPVVAISDVLKDLRELDEPQKVKIPKYIADKIEYCKESGDWDLFQAMDYCFNFRECSSWLETSDNQEKFALAWIFGYDVEKEKQYLVKFKGLNRRYIILKYNKYDKTWFLGGELESDFYRACHTRKELEEAGLGWVLDCPGIELEEVE
jgi:hypothetical protein